ncbi:hypothetical protein E3O28_00790 [Cryobacterium sp. TMT2-14]|nr:hypothetical protein E3O28_00790 [Cryobacterium sp. TMT2-14]
MVLVLLYGYRVGVRSSREL